MRARRCARYCAGIEVVSRIKVDAGIAGIEVGAGIEIISRIAAEENAATATNDNGGQSPPQYENIFRPFFTTRRPSPPSPTVRASVRTLCIHIMRPYDGSRRPATTPAAARFTPVFGQIPLQNRRKCGQEGIRSASAYPTIGASGRRASVHRGTHRGTDSSSTPDRSKG